MKRRKRGLIAGLFCLVLVLADVGPMGLQVFASEVEEEKAVTDDNDAVNESDSEGDVGDEESTSSGKEEGGDVLIEGEDNTEEDENTGGKPNENDMDDEEQNENMDLDDSESDEEEGNEDKSETDDEIELETVDEEIEYENVDETYAYDKKSAVTSGQCGDNLTWGLEDGTLTISGTGKMWDYRNGAPWRFEDFSRLKLEEGITYIGDSAFWNNNGITGDLVIPNSVVEIGDMAFDECTGLSGSLIFPDGLTKIGKSAFYKCSGFKGDLVIPDSVVEIGEGAFSQCSGFDGKLEISNNISKIEVGAFSWCENLKGELLIPDGVTSIEYMAFYGDKSLSGTLIIPDSVQTLGEFAFTDCSGFTGDLIIGNGIVKIPKEAFANCNGFKGKLVIGNNVECIDTGTSNRNHGAFDNCSGFTGDLIIPDSVKIIDDYSFHGCSGFDGKLIIGNGVEYIGDEAFSNCSNIMGDLIIPNNVTQIGRQSFWKCNNLNGNLLISESVESIGNAAFVGCSFIGNLTIGGKLSLLDRAIFETWDGTGNSEGTHIDAPHFAGNLIINEGVTEIGDLFFKDMPFTGSLSLPNSVISIGKRAFENTEFSGNLIIPENVIELGGGAFYNSGFTGTLKLNNNIAILKNDDQYHYGTFEKCGFTGKIEIPDYMESIGNAFRYCEAITELSIPAHVAKNAVFTGCSGLRKVKITDSLKGDIDQINDYMFDGCTSLEIINFPDSVVTIGEYAFRNCKGFDKLDFFNSIVEIKKYAFQGCSSVTTIILSESLQSIGWGVFRDCEGLKQIQAYCNINTLSAFADSEIRIFNSDSVKVIYADNQDNWKQIAYDNSYGITNATAISYSEYINSDGMYPSEIVVPQNCFGVCAVDISTGRLVRKATVTLDGAIYETDLDGMMMQKSSVASAQHFISAQAENYIASEKKYYTTKTGTLTCIEIVPIEASEDKTSSDIDVASDQVGICAVNSTTGKIISRATIIIDGEEISAPNGVLFLVADNMTHSVWATADGYGILPLQEEVFSGGKLITVELPKMDTNIIGVFNGWAGLDVLIDMQRYAVNDDVKSSDLESLIGKTVICTVHEDTITQIIDLNKCLDIKIAMSVYSSDLSHDVQGFIYQNGKFSKKETTVKITIQCILKETYSFISADLFDSLNIEDIMVSVASPNEVKIATDDSVEYQDSIEVAVNKNLKLNESMDFLVKVKLLSDQAPKEASIKQDLNIKIIRGDGYSKAVKRELWIMNADLQQKQVEERKEKEAVSQNKVSKSEIKNTLQNNIVFNLDGTVLDTRYFTKEQLAAIEEFLTLWIVNIDASTDTARNLSRDEEFVKDVLSKLGVNISTVIGISTTTAQIKIRVNTKNDGDRIFCFVLDMQKYHWNDKEPFAGFGNINWFVEDDDNIAKPYRKGWFGMITKANPERLITQMRSLAVDSIKSVYNKTWGNDANKVAEEILNKRILALIKEQYDSPSDMVFTLLLKASQSSVKSGNRTKTVTKCPVDLYIYDSAGNLAGAIIDDVAYPVDNGVHVYMDGSSKVAVYYADEYRIKFVGTGTGTMQHEVYEYRDTGECVRQLEFHDIPLETSKIYYENIPDRLFASSDVYEILEEENAEVIQPDVDTYADRISAIRYVEGISLSIQEFNLKVGDICKLNAQVEPENASIKYIEYESTDENVITVDEEGVITAVNEGVAVIKVVSLDGGYSAECTVIVKNGENVGSNDNDYSDILPEDLPTDGIIPDGLWAAGITDTTYTGAVIRQSFRLYDGTTRLQEKTDYTVSYKNNKAAYTYTDEDYASFEQNLADTGTRTKTGTFNPAKAPQVIIKMKGNYAGTRILYFRIHPADITGDEFAANDVAATYSGKKQTPAPVLSWKGKTLKYGTDFYIPEYDSMKNNKTAFTQSGTYELTITGQNNFTGVIPVTLTISAGTKQMAMNKVTVKGIKNQPWTGSQIMPSGFTVKCQKDVLSEANGDYTVSFGENTAVGTGTVILTGTGTDADGDGYSYIGTKIISFKITGTAMNKVTVSGVEKSYSYTGDAIEPHAVLTYQTDKSNSPVTLTEGFHYTVDYQKNTDKGTATITFTGLASGGYTGTKKQTFRITSSRIEDRTDGDATVEMIQVSFQEASNMQDGVYVAPYMKGGVVPEVVVTSGDKTLQSGRDYTLSYRNNKKPALSTDANAPTVIVKGKGNYTGSRQAAFTIAAKALTNENGIRVVAADKTASAKKNGYRQKFKIYDADGKALGTGDYDKTNVTYTLLQIEDADGTVSEKNEQLDQNSIVPAGSVIQITVQGKGVYAGGSATGTYRILDSGYDISKATIQINNQSYTGKPVLITEQGQFKEGKVYVKIGKEKRALVLGQDIEVVPDSYIRNVNRGTAKVTFRGINSFGGTKTVSYKIGVRSISEFWKGIFNKVNRIFSMKEVPMPFLKERLETA